MIRTARFSLLMVLALATAPAGAKVSNEPQMVGMALQLAAVAQPMTGKHSYALGDGLLRSELLWQAAGAVDADRTVTFGDKTTQFVHGAFHPLAQLILPNKTDVVPAVCKRVAAAAYRSMEKGVGKILFGGKLFKDIAKAAQDHQICLADTDGDHQFETAVLVHGGLEGAEAVKAIEPVTVHAERLVPISSDDYVRLTYSELSGKSSVYFEFEVVSQGQKRTFQIFDFTVDGKSEQLHSQTGIWAKKRPTPVRLLGLDFHISEIDPATKALELDWGGQAREPFLVEVPEETGVEYRPY